MKWLVVAVFILAQQPVEAPKGKGAAEAYRAKSTAHPKSTQSNQGPSAQPTPASTQTAIATESQRSTTTTNEHTGTSTQATSDEDSATQRKLTWFTGVLAGVGILQLVVMFLTWLVYRRQATEMRRQRFEMARQRHEIWRQRGVMRSQLKAMEDQAIQMVEQTNVLERSVDVAKESSDAAKVSSDIAARVSIPTLKIHRFAASKAAATSVFAFLQFPKFEIIVKNYGQTPAFLRSWTLKISCENLPEVPVYKDGKSIGIPLEKRVIQAGESFTLPELEFYQRDRLSLEDAQAVIDRIKDFTVYGFVCYEDIFGNPTQRLKFCEILLNIHGDMLEWTGLFSRSAYVGTDLYPTTR